MRIVVCVVVLLLVVLPAFADSVSYNGDPYGTSASVADPAYFQYDLTVGAGGETHLFYVVAYPTGNPSSDYVNINDPGSAWNQGQYTDDLGQALGDSAYDGITCIYWQGGAISGGGAVTFSFESTVHGVQMQSWASDGTGLGDTSGPIDGPAPEPTTTLLFSAGLLGLIGCGLKRRRVRSRKA